MKKLVLISLLLIHLSNFLLAQELIIEGFVYDKISNQPLVDVNITLLNSKIGTSTDDDGFFPIPQASGR